MKKLLDLIVRAHCGAAQRSDVCYSCMRPILFCACNG